MDDLLHIQTQGIQNDGKDTYYNHRYEPTPYSTFTYLASYLSLQKQDHFVDFGCGKGRSNFYIHHQFHCFTTGVEYNPSYYKYCQNNWNTYHGAHKSKIKFVCVKAQAYDILPTQNYFYFFNPFSLEIFRMVVQNILKSYEQQVRTLTLLLYYPDAEYLYYLNTYTPFVERERIPVPMEYNFHRNPKISNRKKQDDNEFIAIFTLSDIDL